MMDYQEHSKSGLDSEMPKLELIPNQFGSRYMDTVIAEEFTSICPKTGFPDYGVITITYIPNKHYIELKSLKFYLQAYLNVGIFYESLVNKILDDIVKAIAPVQITVQGEFSVRGGIRSIVRAERT